MNTTQSIYAKVTGHQDTYPHSVGDTAAYAPAPVPATTAVVEPSRKPRKVSGYLAQSLRSQGLTVSASGKTGDIVLTLKAGTIDALLAEVTKRGYRVLASTTKTVTIR